MSDAPKVLLVDDNPGDILLIREAMKAAGLSCDVLIASDGVEAMESLRAAASGGRAVDIVLLDINMPRMNGRETLVAIKRSEELMGAQVVMLSTSQLDSDIAFCVNNGADLYVSKASDFDQCIESMSNVFNYWKTGGQNRQGR